MSEFGDEVRAWRKRNRLVQKQAADVIQVSLRTYQNWEQGSHAPLPPAQAEYRRRMAEQDLRDQKAALFQERGKQMDLRSRANR